MIYVPDEDWCIVAGEHEKANIHDKLEKERLKLVVWSDTLINLKLDEENKTKVGLRISQRVLRFLGFELGIPMKEIVKPTSLQIFNTAIDKYAAKLGPYILARKNGIIHHITKTSQWIDRIAFFMAIDAVSRTFGFKLYSAVLDEYMFAIYYYNPDECYDDRYYPALVWKHYTSENLTLVVSPALYIKGLGTCVSEESEERAFLPAQEHDLRDEIQSWFYTEVYPKLSHQYDVKELIIARQNDSLNRHPRFDTTDIFSFITDISDHIESLMFTRDVIKPLLWRYLNKIDIHSAVQMREVLGRMTTLDLVHELLSTIDKSNDPNCKFLDIELTAWTLMADDIIKLKN